MKDMKTQVKEAAYIVLAIGVIAVAISAFTGCAPGWDQGNVGQPGPQGVGAGVVTTNLPTACNGNGGVQVVTFVDPTNTGLYRPSDTITSSSLVCNGSQGAAGQNGTSSTVGMTAATATQCPNGGYELTVTDASGSNSYSLCDGQNGATGSQGLQGIQGVAGVAGAPGTVVSTVQFCPGATSYAGEFNEVGFCIGGNIYAVYSANDGFMSEIPPGEYSSDGINASCNFTVGANCSITQN